MADNINTDVQDAPVDMTVTQPDITVTTPLTDEGNVATEPVSETTPVAQEPGNVGVQDVSEKREQGKISQLETENAQYRGLYEGIVKNPDTYHKVLMANGYSEVEAAQVVRKSHPNYGSTAKSSTKATKKQNANVDPIDIDSRIEQKIADREFNQEIASFDARHKDLDPATREDILLIAAVNQRRGMSIPESIKVAEKRLLTADQLKEAELNGQLKQAAAVKATAAGASGSVAKTGSGKREYVATDSDEQIMREMRMGAEERKIFLEKQAKRVMR